MTSGSTTSSSNPHNKRLAGTASRAVQSRALTATAVIGFTSVVLSLTAVIVCSTWAAQLSERIGEVEEVSRRRKLTFEIQFSDEWLRLVDDVEASFAISQRFRRQTRGNEGYNDDRTMTFAQTASSVHTPCGES